MNTRRRQAFLHENLPDRRRFLQVAAAVAGGALAAPHGWLLRAAADEPRQPAPRIPRRKKRTANVGIFGVGHYTYWSQFPGLRDDMLRKMAVLVKKVEGREVERHRLRPDRQRPGRLRPCCPSSRPPTSTWCSATW